jgi:hypothetical protein
VAPEINHSAATHGKPELVVFSESKETTGYLVKLEKAHKKNPLKPAALLDKTLEILSRYDFSSYDGESAEDLNAGLSAADLEPVIILSESFSNPA